MQARNEDRGVGEALAVLTAIGLVAVAVVVTYAREPVSELYNVSISGFAGGLSRAIVFLNFPAAIIAIPVALISAGRLGGRRAAVVGAVSAGLCGVVFWPGDAVITQSDLDVRPVNAAPAAGVAIAAILTIAAWRRFGASFAPRLRGDRVRLVLAASLVLGAVPWIAAEAGVSFDGIPVLGTIWQTGELRTEPGHPIPAPAVHHGHHHGMDGVLLALAALALSRMCVPRLRLLVRAYLALMFAYGLGNAVQDGWLEQVVKRSWTSRTIPSVLVPELSLAWAAIVFTATVILAVSTLASRPARSSTRQASAGPR